MRGGEGDPDAEPGARRPWRPETAATIFSGTKGMVAVCLALLMHREQIDLDRPVSAYWPEFESAGKERVLVDTWSRTSPLSPDSPHRPRSWRRPTPYGWLTCSHRSQLLAPPGVTFYYHALTFGWPCGVLVRRVDGRTVGQTFQEEFATPLDLSAWIGVPVAQEGNVAVTVSHEGNRSPRPPAWNRTTDPLAWSIWANPRRFDVDPLPANTRAWRAAEVPASNGVATAIAMAKLYESLVTAGPSIQGLAGSGALAKARQRLIDAVDQLLGKRMAFGVGVQLQADLEPFGPPVDGFDHSGTAGSVHGAWPALRTGFSYVTNTICVEPDVAGLRASTLLVALHDVLSN